MHSRLGRLVVAVAVLLVAGAPAAAQETSTAVRFDGVSFLLDASIGNSVNSTLVPGDPPDNEMFGFPHPEAVVFTVYDARAEGARVPRVGDASVTIRAYRTADLAGYQEVGARAAAIEALLADRPDLAGSTAAGADALPFLPAFEAAQVLRAAPVYVDAPGVSGVAYLTGYAQDLFPFTSDSIWYTFQGLSTDGEWYVALLAMLDTDLLPEQVNDRQVQRATRDWDAYLARTVRKLEGAEPQAFTPALSAVDGLARSLTFGEQPAETSAP
jgi:hypothetical protein